MMSCGTGGVVGIVPGVIGLLEVIFKIGQLKAQALEAIKLIIGLPDILHKKLLLFDGMSATFKKAKIRGRNPYIQILAL